jgi:hypothetical protein
VAERWGAMTLVAPVPQASNHPSGAIRQLSLFLTLGMLRAAMPAGVVDGDAAIAVIYHTFYFFSIFFNQIVAQ